MKKAERDGRRASEFNSALNRYSKIHNCILCGKHMTSACNSHIVPQFVLRNITENGQISYGTALNKRAIFESDKPTGINNAHTFRLICKECDRSRFCNYENPFILERFDSLDSYARNQVLCEMAIKAHVAHINLKYRNMVTRDMFTSGQLGEKERRGEVVFLERFDIEEHEQSIKRLSKNHESGNNQFTILYDKVLNYTTKIATQTVINFLFDLNGKQIFDPLFFIDNKCHYFYLMILPFEKTTRVLFYVENQDAEDVSSIVEQFRDLNEEERIHFLFIALIVHDEQFFMSPSLADEIKKNDKKLVGLYSKTDELLAKHRKAIKDFRKYKNYLLVEKN